MTCILQISSGQGPAECQRFVPLLAEIIRKEASDAGVACHPLTDFSTEKIITCFHSSVETFYASQPYRSRSGGDDDRHSFKL